MIKKGDTIGIIALAGPCEKNKIKLAKENLENLGFNVILSSNIYDEDKYLAGSDKEKIKELHSFFMNPSIKLILNARGGYGSLRLINKIDYELIRQNPKPFCGYSDITALLLMFYKKCGLITYHGLMACSDFIQSDFKQNTISNFFDFMNSKEIEIKSTKTYNKGFAEGILWGGNLATVVSLCGQDFIPDEDFIFFTEDINEPVYKIDKMFTQLFNIEKFKTNCKGIVLGEFLNVDNKLWLEDLYKEFSIPTIMIDKITHSIEKITLPIGEKAYIKENLLIIKREGCL